MNEISLNDGGFQQPNIRSRTREEREKMDRWRNQLEALLPCLTAKQQAVINGVAGLDGCPPKTPSELARELGVTRQAVAKHRNLAVQKLRQLNS